jgi:hypothetical protein
MTDFPRLARDIATRREDEEVMDLGAVVHDSTVRRFEGRWDALSGHVTRVPPIRPQDGVSWGRTLSRLRRMSAQPSPLPNNKESKPCVVS